MSNYSALSLYIVESGEASPCAPDAEFDGIGSVMVAATSPQAALKIAEASDEGRIQADNLAWGDQTISCLTMRDEFGDYL